MLQHESGVVYESPDGGHTVYSRQVGSTERTLIYKSPASVLVDRKRKWHAILELMESNPALKRAVEHAELIYEIVKEEK